MLKMSKLTSKEIEKITRPRDLKNMKRAVSGIVKNNDDDDLMNINGGDIYIINENFKITYMDLKPTLKYDFRRQYYFELEIIYPNGTTVDSWARHKGFSNRQYVAFTDEHRITMFRQKDIYEVIKELEEKRPTEVLTKDKDQYGNPETDFNGNICKKKYCLIGVNRNYDLLKKLNPIIRDITDKRVTKTDIEDIKEFDKSIKAYKDLSNADFKTTQDALIKISKCKNTLEEKLYWLKEYLDK